MQAYTSETQRLGRRSLDPSVLAVCVFALLIIIAIAHAPQPASLPLPAVDNHVEVFSHNCIGYCP
jgi:hypothetical protein